MRAGLPGRTDLLAAYDAGSKGYLINQATPAYVALVTALAAAGVDVKVNYPAFPSASLVGAGARTSKRRTTAEAGGVTVGQSTAISHLDLLTRDANGRKAVTRIPVSAVALPAGYQAKIDAVVDAITDAALAGVSLLTTPEMIWYTRVVIEQTVLSSNLPAAGDKSVAWRFQALPTAGSGYVKPFSFALPCRNVQDTDTTEVSKGKVIDTENSHFQSLITALGATGVDMVTPYQTDIRGELKTAYAIGTSRKAPNL
jgi:hypothetical protein